MDQPVEGQDVYEFDLEALSQVDRRFGVVLQSFLASCSIPSLYKPSHQSRTFHPEFYRCSQLGPTENHMRMESRKKVISLIQGVARRFTHSLHSLLHGEGVNPDDWTRRNGKFTRDSLTPNTHVKRCIDTLDEILREEGSSKIVHRGNFFYPPGGYREWHTNRHDPPGWRLYLVHTTGSAFRFVSPDSLMKDEIEIFTLIDKDCSMRLFKVGTGRGMEDPIFWHTVYSEGERWSLGVLLSDQQAAMLKLLASRI